MNDTRGSSSTSFGKHLGYAIMMGTRPQTLTGFADSPVGCAAFMIDHDDRSYELIARVFEGRPEGLTRDDILDNITLYWLTNTSISAARLYWENKLAFFVPKGVSIPVAVSAFPDELFKPRGAGSSGRTPSSRTTGSATRADTSPPGSSPRPWWRTFAKA